MGLFDKFKSSVEQFSGSKQVAEAVVSIMYGVAHAEGGAGTEEAQKIRQAMSSLEILKQYPSSVHYEFIDRKLKSAFEFGTEAGLDRCLEELQDVRKRPEHEKVSILRTGKIVGEADGSLSAPERDFLLRCARTLEVSPSEVGL